MVHVKRVERSDYGVVQMTIEATPDSGEILNMAVKLIGWAIASDPGNAFYTVISGTLMHRSTTKRRHSTHSAMPWYCNRMFRRHMIISVGACAAQPKYLNPKAFRDGEKARA